MSDIMAGAPASPDETRTTGRLRRLGTGMLPQLLSVLLLVLVWEGVSRLVSRNVFPSLSQVVAAFIESLQDGYVLTDILVTSRRLALAFGLAMLVALTLGLIIGRVRWVARMFEFWITIAAALPSILYIVIAYLWLGLNDTAAILAAALVVTPSATFNVIQGVRAIDPGLSEMARAFRMPQTTIVRRVLMPQTLPYLFAAGRTCLALTWKIVIFVELMGRSSGVGYRIQYFYSLFNMERVLASALPFMLIMLLIELVVIRRAEAHLFRWRREEAR